MHHNHDHGHSLCPVLRDGASGAAVKELQKRLRAEGYDPGKIDGVFGSKTKTAVLSFQASNHLVQDGIVGRKTWTALGVNCKTPPGNHCPTLVVGNTGPATANLQRLLKTKGFYTGKLDGIFGPQTKAAVLSFQSSKNLAQDGIVGIKTWTALGVNCF